MYMCQICEDQFKTLEIFVCWKWSPRPQHNREAPVQIVCGTCAACFVHAQFITLINDSETYCWWLWNFRYYPPSNMIRARNRQVLLRQTMPDCWLAVTNFTTWSWLALQQSSATIGDDRVENESSCSFWELRWATRRQRRSCWSQAPAAKSQMTKDSLLCTMHSTLVTSKSWKTCSTIRQDHGRRFTRIWLWALPLRSDERTRGTMFCENNKSVLDRYWLTSNSTVDVLG